MCALVFLCSALVLFYALYNEYVCYDAVTISSVVSLFLLPCVCTLYVFSNSHLPTPSENPCQQGKNGLCYNCCVAGRLQGKLLPSLRQSNENRLGKFSRFSQSAYVRRRFLLDAGKKPHTTNCFDFILIIAEKQWKLCGSSANMPALTVCFLSPAVFVRLSAENYE